MGVKTRPVPKLSGVVQRSQVWRTAIAAIEEGRTTEIKVGKIAGVANPINAMVRALKRKYMGKGHLFYARAGIVYIVPKV